MEATLWHRLELDFIEKVVSSFSGKEGNMAEVGTYNGISAEAICKNKGSNNFFVFDTFEGLPDVLVPDLDNAFKPGWYSSDIEDVKRLLSPFKNVFIYKGIFPKDIPKEISLLKFLFVHIDTDIYKSTVESLLFFLPRMEKDGLILLHDCGTAGVDVALDVAERHFEFDFEIAFRSHGIIKNIIARAEEEYEVEE